MSDKLKCVLCGKALKIHQAKDNKETATCIKCNRTYKVVYIKGTYIKTVAF